jgi:hypothetical protein
MSSQLESEITENHPPSASCDNRHDDGTVLGYYTEPFPFRLVYSSSVLFAGRRCGEAGASLLADSDVIIKVYYGADGMAAGTREHAALERVKGDCVVEILQARAHMSRKSMILIEEKWSVSLGALLLLPISDPAWEWIHRKRDLQRQVCWHY